MTFIFLKVLQSFFRGTIDNKDYHNSSVASKISDIAPYINQYSDWVDKAGHSGYIIYSLLSYFFSYIFIRGCVIGFCYLIYRNQYIQALFELAKKRKKKIADRIKKKEEERKIQEEWVKNNLQQHNDQKEIEMIKL